MCTKIMGALAGLVLALGAAAQEEGEDLNSLQLAVTHAGPAEYQPGQPVEILVTISASAEGSVTALGLLDGAPDTWTFAAARAISGDLPAVQPPVGSAGKLEFAWITIPQFPYSFAYTLQVPPDAAGQAVVQGQAEYRTNAGRQLTTPDFITIEGPENLAPTITLLGGDSITVQQGTPFQDPGYTASDPEDGDITGKVQVTGSVNTSTPGDYVITYNVRDKGGQSAPTVSRTVIVTPNEDDDDGGSGNGGNNGGGNNGGGTGGTPNRPSARNRVLTGGPGMGPGGGRVRDENLANVGNNGTDTAPLAGTNDTASARTPAANISEEQLRARELAKNLAAQGPNSEQGASGIVVPGAVPPVPGPRTAAMAKNAAPGAPAAEPVKPATPEEAEDLKALDSALGIDPAAGAGAPPDATGQSPAPAEPVQVAAVDPAPVALAPRTPGLVERVKLRVGGFGRAELMTIAAAGAVLLGLSAFAAVAGRIAYAGPTRRKGAGKVVAAE